MRLYIHDAKKRRGGTYHQQRGCYWDGDAAAAVAPLALLQPPPPELISRPAFSGQHFNVCLALSQQNLSADLASACVLFKPFSFSSHDSKDMDQLPTWYCHPGSPKGGNHKNDSPCVYCGTIELASVLVLFFSPLSPLFDGRQSPHRQKKREKARKFQSAHVVARLCKHPRMSEFLRAERCACFLERDRNRYPSMWGFRVLPNPILFTAITQPAGPSEVLV